MPNLNRVMLMGNLTRDPELRFTPNNMAVAAIGLAINRRYKDAQGEWREETDFIDCECFGRRAEVLNQYMRKGRPLFVEGRLKLDRWEDRDGNKRSKMKVVIENFEFIDGGGGGGGRGGEAPADDYNHSRSNYQSGPPQAGASGGGYPPSSSGGGGGDYRQGPPPRAQQPSQQQPHPTMEEDDIPF